MLNQVYTEQLKTLLAHAGIDITRVTKFAKGTMYIYYMNEEARQAPKLDDILCLYLIDVSEVVLVNFYKMVACFVQLFRNCINHYGLEVTTGIAPVNLESEPFPTRSSPLGSFVAWIDKKKSKLFTQKNKADLVPHFANIFLDKFLEEKCNIFPRGHAVKLMEHLCLWMHQRKFTGWQLK